MQGYQLSPDHIIIGGPDQKGEVSLTDGYIVAISIENLVTSPNKLLYGLNEGSANKVPMDAGDRSRDYRAQDICGIPGYYKGKLNWQFVDPATGAPVQDNANSGLVIVTRIIPIPQELPEAES